MRPVIESGAESGNGEVNRHLSHEPQREFVRPGADCSLHEHGQSLIFNDEKYAAIGLFNGIVEAVMNGQVGSLPPATEICS